MESSTSSLTRLAKGAFELTITIPENLVEKTYDHYIEEAIKNAEIKGFRRGAAPREKVEPVLDQSQLHDKVVQALVPRAYIEAVQRHHLDPVLNPQVRLVSVKPKENWQIEATSCEAPEVVLGNYKAEVKKALVSDSLWTPGQGDPTQKKEDNKDAKIDKILNHLLSVITIEPADILISEEANHSLARLIDQTQQLGLTVEQYLSSIGKTAEALRAEYAQSAKNNLQTEFLLSAVIDDLNITVDEKDVDQLINSTPDPQTRKSLETPQSKSSIRTLLARRRALDSLLEFA